MVENKNNTEYNSLLVRSDAHVFVVSSKMEMVLDLLYNGENKISMIKALRLMGKLQNRDDQSWSLRSCKEFIEDNWDWSQLNRQFEVKFK